MICHLWWMPIEEKPYPLSWAYRRLNRIRLALIREWESRDRFVLD